jgi:hypothetical protein
VFASRVSSLLQRYPSGTLSWLYPPLAFLVMLAFGWRIHVLDEVPGHGDVLEVIWGMEWYYQQLFVHHASPLFDPLVFHPNGWHTATLAHTPLFFLIGALIIGVSSSAGFAYNLMALSGLVVAYVGSLRFLRLYTTGPAVIGAALAFTFLGFRWQRISSGHLHIFLATALLPWFFWSLVQLRRLPAGKGEPERWRQIFVAGLLWGMMIHFSLYSLFLGAIGFVLWGRELLNLARLRQMCMIVAVALFVASPLLWLYWTGSQADRTVDYGISHVLRWSASANALFNLNLEHPVEPLRSLARFVYTGPRDESGQIGLGWITTVLAVIGAILVWRRRREHRDLFWLSVVGLILSLGLLMRWDGHILQWDGFRAVNQAIWSLGHWLQPSLFDVPDPLPFFDRGLPLPALLLSALVPFWGAARVLARYAFVAALGMIGLAAIGLAAQRPLFRWLLLALWLVEFMPTPITGLPLPQQAHPAYQWVTHQSFSSGEGIIDLTADPPVVMAGEIVYATLFTQIPTASGVGSFAPEHTQFLQDYLYGQPERIGMSETALILGQYGIRFVLFHMQKPGALALWEHAQHNPALVPVDCFAPSDEPSPWDYPICVAEVRPPHWEQINLHLHSGWSGTEPWGVWSENSSSTATWVATRSQIAEITIGAFPFCVEGRTQSIEIRVNDSLLESHRWVNCDPWQATIVVPAELVRVGLNEIAFYYGYALRPVDLSEQESPDTRALAVGFTMLQVSTR